MELLLCHSDSYLSEIEVNVLACFSEKGGYRVETDRSIAYPGGGGQPEDHAWIGEHRVTSYHGYSGGSVCFQLATAPALGAQTMRIDWSRRFDHMQQHSAQHMITAIAQRQFGWSTVAFHLNPDRSDVVLDVERPSWTEILLLEDAVNEAIRSAIPVQQHQMTRAEVEAGGARYRRLPKNDQQLRVIRIGDVDLNPCGGTHVKNTSDLQVVRMLSAQPDEGKTRLHFLAGGRVIGSHRAAVERAAALTGLLSEPPESHVGAIERMQGQLATTRRSLEHAEARYGQLWVRGRSPGRTVHTIHRASADAAFLTSISREAEAAAPDDIFLVTLGNRADGGQFHLFGPEGALGRVMPEVIRVLDGRGGGRGRRRQGKAAQPGQGQAAVEAVERLLAETSA